MCTLRKNGLILPVGIQGFSGCWRWWRCWRDWNKRLATKRHKKHKRKIKNHVFLLCFLCLLWLIFYFFPRQNNIPFRYESSSAFSTFFRMTVESSVSGLSDDRTDLRDLAFYSSYFGRYCFGIEAGDVTCLRGAESRSFGSRALCWPSAVAEQVEFCA